VVYGEKEAGNLFSGSGIMFSEIDPEDQDLIIEFVKEQAKRFGLD